MLLVVLIFLVHLILYKILSQNGVVKIIFRAGQSVRSYMYVQHVSQMNEQRRNAELQLSVPVLDNLKT
jgi:uncharacterized membrane-anchored protein YitT (DUF2179 family)